MTDLGVKGPWFSRAGLWIFMGGLAIRGLYLMEASAGPTFQMPVVDAHVYHQAAAGLVRGEGFSSSYFYQPFFYPFCLAGLYWVSGTSILAAKMVQILLGAITCVLVFHLGQRIFNRRAGLAAGWITVFYGPLIFYEAELLATGLAALFAVLLVLLFLKGAEKKSPLLYGMLGFVGALSVLTRPTFLLLFLVGAAWMVMKQWQSSTKRSRLALPVVVLLAGFMAPTLAVSILNQQVTGHFGFMPASGGLNLYLGNSASYEDTVNARPGSQWSDVIDLPRKHGVRGDMWDRQDFFLGKVREDVAAAPWDCVKRLAWKSAQFLSSRETARNVDLYLFRDTSLVLEILVWKAGLFGFPFGLLLPLALVGFFFNLKRMPLLLPAALAVYGLSVILVFVTARYRMPMIPLFAVLGGAGIQALIRMIRAPRPGPRWAGAGLILCTLLLATVPGPFEAEGMDYEAELHCCVGGALARSGRVDEAVEAFRSALALDPDYVDAHVNLATLYIRQGKMKEALAACEQALALDPNLAQAHNNLAVLLTGEGRYDEARAHCLAGLRIRPHEEAFHFNLARIHAEQGDPAGVESELKAALVSNPAHLPSHEALARHQMQQGRFEEAREHLQKMTEIDPARADAWFERGNSLVRDGFLKEAVPCLEQAARLAPRDLLARHTLAVALSGCGRSREGICAYQEVLAMDPDFVPSLAGLAWLLSTDPDPDIRDADQALRLAEQAAQLDGAHPNVLSTLAAAYGSAGQFQKAVEAGERAILQARRAGMGGLARKIEARLVLYRAGKPYRASKGR